MATTLTDILRDLAQDAGENALLPYEDQKDQDVIVEEYRDMIIRRLVGE